MHYIHTDFQGSYQYITDANKGLEQTANFDAWGNRRNLADWTYNNVPTTPLMFDRGYTGHEHLEKVGLINMIGRIYDPKTSRFLSPDNFVQQPNNPQSYNRYSYCFNNPLLYTDPSGWISGNAGLRDVTNYYLDGDPISPFLGHLLTSPRANYDFTYQRGYSTSNNFSYTATGRSSAGGEWRPQTVECVTTMYLKEVGYEYAYTGFGYQRQSIFESVYIRVDECKDWVFVRNEDYDKLMQTINSDRGGKKEGGVNNSNYSLGTYTGVITSYTGILGQIATYANSQEPNVFIGGFGKYTTSIGIAGEVVSNVLNGINLIHNPTWGNGGRLAVSLGTTSLNFIPYIGPFVSFSVSAYDADGGFNDFYNTLDQSQLLYNQTGIIVLPNFINNNPGPLILYRIK